MPIAALMAAVISAEHIAINSAMLRIGSRVTRHPRMGAVEELKVPLGELAGLGPHRDRDLSRRTVLVRPAKQDHGHPLHRQTPRKKYGRAFQKLIANDAGFFAFTLRGVEERSQFSRTRLLHPPREAEVQNPFGLW